MRLSPFLLILPNIFGCADACRSWPRSLTHASGASWPNKSTRRTRKASHDNACRHPFRPSISLDSSDFLSAKQGWVSSDVLLAAATRRASFDSDSCANRRKITTLVIRSLRGGSTSTYEEDDADSEYEEEYDSEEEDQYEEEVTDDEQSANEEQVDQSASASSSLTTSLQSKSSKDQQPYDTLLTPPPMQQFLISLSVMFLSQRIDIFSPRVVAIARACFVGYIIAVQLFLLYVRTRVKQNNDRTEIVLSNPLASFVAGMQNSNNGATSSMVKSITSQLLTTHTTVYEYDLQQVKSMQSSLLMPMIILYFLHFRMKQMQPLLMQTVTGVMNLIYCPLWQVYVLGRRLERPFGSGGGAAMSDGDESVEESKGRDQNFFDGEANEEYEDDEDENVDGSEADEEVEADDSEADEKATDDEQDEESDNETDESEED
eukprot:CCRYP_008815-RA/>CCRYP_008815-RA protein AED:0.18 eAED:0.06 QI:0/-1/0/1/-1/0/1/0/431